MTGTKKLLDRVTQFITLLFIRAPLSDNLSRSAPQCLRGALLMNTASPHGIRARVTNRCRGEATTVTCQLLLPDFRLGREATDVIAGRDIGECLWASPRSSDGRDPECCPLLVVIVTMVQWWRWSWSWSIDGRDPVMVVIVTVFQWWSWSRVWSAVGRDRDCGPAMVMIVTMVQWWPWSWLVQRWSWQIRACDRDCGPVMVVILTVISHGRDRDCGPVIVVILTVVQWWSWSWLVQWWSWYRWVAGDRNWWRDERYMPECYDCECDPVRIVI
jgi:hypothetical protein